MRRFWVEPEALDRSPVLFGPREARHMARVLRLRAGGRVIAFDGRREVEVIIERVDEEGVTARLDGVVRPARRPVEVVLLQGLPRGPRMDLVVRMGTEIGLAAIYPVLAARSVPDPGSGRLARWRRVAQQAARQCGRGDLPEIHPPAALDRALEALGPTDLFVIPWEGERRPIGEVIAGRPFARAAVLIGPEGGLTAEEVAAARAAGGATVSLGDLVLRTETAGIATAAMLLYERLLRTPP